MYDIAIIGGGIIGCSIARELSKYKVSVIVIEKENDLSCGASKANSGIIHGGYDAKNNTKKGYFSYKGNQMFESLNKELNFGYSKIGSIVLAFNEKDYEALEEMKTNGIKSGVKNLEIIDRKTLENLEPNINQALGGLYCREAGIVSPYEYCIALAENAIKNKAEFIFNSEVTNISKVDIDNQHNYEIKTKNNNLIKSRIVINCGGVYSDTISNMVNKPYFNIIPRKGQYLLYNRGYNDIINHVIFQCPSSKGKGVLVTPTYHNNLMIGPNAEVLENSDKENKSTDLPHLLEIIEKSKKSIKGIDNKKIIRSFSGIRATSNLKDFIIEETESKKFINIAGIDSPGLTSSPAIAKYVVLNIIKNLIQLEKKDNFDPYRKPNIIKKDKKDFLPIKQVSELTLLEEGNIERIVCRCEQVREKEVMESLNREIRVTTTDGVKRRTRCGMGICQGKYCKPRVKSIIENKYKLSKDKTYVEDKKFDRVEIEKLRKIK